MTPLSPTRKAGLVAGLALALVLASPAYAGGPTDPVGGEQKLGQVAGIKYVREDVVVGSSGSWGPPYEGTLIACGGHTASWHVIAGGVRVTGSSEQNLIASTRPMDLDPTFETPDDTKPDDWFESVVSSVLGRTMTGYAVCTKRPLSYRWKSVPAQPSSERTAKVSCPSGKHVVGGGAFIATTGSHVNSSYPLKNGWRTRIHDTVGGNGGMEVYAVCRSLGKVRHVSKTATGVASGTTKSVVARCRPNEHVAGGGGRITGSMTEAHLAATYPVDNGDRGTLPDDGWKVVARNSSGAAKKVTAVALCVRKG